MRIYNPLRINDWPLKPFLATVLLGAVLLWIIVGLDEVGWMVPGIRGPLVLVYLLFVPGALVLRIIRHHNLDGIEALLFTVGLSVAVIMFLGATLNFILPFLGIERPISLAPLRNTIALAVLALSAVCWFRERSYSGKNIHIRVAVSPPLLFLLLLPFLSIFGTYLVNYYHSNMLLMALIAVTGITVICIGFDRFIPRGLYPLAVFSIALSLLFYRSLISTYISGYDIHEEYYIANYVLSGGHWDAQYSFILNNMLSVTMLAPVISVLTAIDLTGLFKVIYPSLFALVLLGLYRAFRNQSDERTAFFAVFFFMSVSYFYTNLATILRQQIATIFLVLLLFLIMDKRISERKRTLFFLVFSASMAVSHYTLSFIVMAYLALVWLLLYLLDNPKIGEMINRLFARLPVDRGVLTGRAGGSSNDRNAEVKPIKIGYIAIFLGFALAWYVITSGSLVFTIILNAAINIINSIIRDFLNPQASHGLTILVTPPKSGLLHTANLIVNYFNQLLIISGICLIVLKPRILKLEKEFVAFSVLSLGFLAAGVLVPVLTLRIDMERLYQIALIFLAPVVIVALLAVIRWVGWLTAAAFHKVGIKRLFRIPALSLVSLYLAMFFTFQTGFTWELTEPGYSKSVSISQEGVRKYGNALAKARFYSAITQEQEVFSARWLAEHKDPQARVFATYNDSQVHTLTSYGMMPTAEKVPLTPRTEAIPEGDYVYLQYLNVTENIGTEFLYEAMFGLRRKTFEMDDVSYLFNGKRKIYTNDGSEIYK